MREKYAQIQGEINAILDNPKSNDEANAAYDKLTADKKQEVDALVEKRNATNDTFEEERNIGIGLAEAALEMQQRDLDKLRKIYASQQQTRMQQLDLSAPKFPTKRERSLGELVIDLIKKTGIEVSTDTEEMNREMERGNVRLHARLSSLEKAAATIRGWMKNGTRGKSFTIELPKATINKIKAVMGRDFDSHNITANSLAHAIKNHGENGLELESNSIPIRNEDLGLIPYIMTSPDYVTKGSNDGTMESVRFYKTLSNGYVVVVEKEQKNSPDDMDTITMWAELSSNAIDARQKSSPMYHAQNAIISTDDAAKIRKDAEDAIIKEEISQKLIVSENGFYSNAEKAVEGIKQDKATPQQWLAMIENNGGLKVGEDKWIGLSDFLKNNTEKTLTKQQILDFINQNKIQIEEKTYSITEEDFDTKRSNFIDDYIEKFDDEIEEIGEYAEKEYKDKYPEPDENDYETESDYGWEVYNDALDNWSECLYDYVVDAKQKRNYELFDEASEKFERIYGKNSINTNFPNPINHTRLNYTTESLENKREIALTVPTIESWNNGDEIHFGDAGNGRAVAWVRFGETTDSEGKRVLVIDEIQSKRHQEGRENGYDSNGGEIPDAPFEKNWHELAMKRMLRYAAENGFDKVAWTTGEQQAERYNLQKSVNKIVIDENDGKYTVMARPNGEQELREIETDITPERLVDVVGKTIAQRAIEEGGLQLEGEELKIGGGGMKGFYDKILPDFMNKYGKKWGVKVGEVMMPKLNKADQVMHSVDVTDAMKESVMEGQPQFLRTQSGEIYGFVKNGKMYLDPKLINPETPIHEYTHLWDTAIQKMNPDLWKRGVELMKQTSVWQEVTNDPAYADIKGDENLVASEVHSRLTGKQGADIFEKMAREVSDSNDALEATEKASLLGAIKRWVNDVWKYVKDTFAPWSKEEADRVSLKEFVNMPIKDLLGGKQMPRSKQKVSGEEQLDLTAPKANKAQISAIAKILEKLGLKGNVSIVGSTAELMERARQAKIQLSEQRRQIVETVNDRFNRELQEQIDGTQEKGHVYQLGTPSPVLLSAGMPNLPIELSADRLSDKSKQENHPFDIKNLSNLPQAIQNPIAVFDSRTKEDMSVILTELKQDGNNFVVAMRVRKSPNGLEIDVNDIRSIYPKDRVGGVVEWINGGLLRYADKKKITDFITQSTNLIGGEKAGNNMDVISAAKVIQNFVNPKVSDENRYQSVYHGSPHAFDRFDFSHMGEGEGVQAYGWGGYVSEVEGIGRNYAESNHKDQEDIDAEVADWKMDAEIDLDIGTREYFGISEPIFIEDGYSIGDADRDKLIEEAEKYYNKKIDKGDEDEVESLFDKLFSDMNNYWKEEFDNRKQEFINSLQSSSNLYRVEIPDDNGSNYLHWGKPMTSEQAKMISEQAEKEGYADYRIAYIDENDGSLKLNGSLNSVEFFYKDLSRVLGSDKAASEFLNRAGLTGISYPAEHQSGGREDGARNYVIFNENDMKITDHTRYALNKQGEVAGATLPNGDVVLVESAMRIDTPFHEFAHKLFTYAKENKATSHLYDAIMKLVQEAPQNVKDYVSSHYPNLKGDAYLDEVFAWALSAQNKGNLQKFLEDRGLADDTAMETLRMQAWYVKMWDAIKKLWESVKRAFGQKYADLSVYDAYEKMSGENLAQEIYDTMMGGKELPSLEEKENQPNSARDLTTKAQNKADGVKVQKAFETLSELSKNVAQKENALGWGYGIYFEKNKADGKYYATRYGERGERTLTKTEIPDKKDLLNVGDQEYGQTPEILKKLAKLDDVIMQIPAFREMAEQYADEKAEEDKDDHTDAEIEGFRKYYTDYFLSEKIPNADMYAGRSFYDDLVSLAQELFPNRTANDNYGHNPAGEKIVAGWLQKCGIKGTQFNHGTSFCVFNTDDMHVKNQIRFQVSDQIEDMFDDAVAGDLKGKPLSIGKLTRDGKNYLEKISGLQLKPNVDFVLNPSDLRHIYNEHFGDNEKDKGNNIPLTKHDIRRIVDVVSFPTQVVYGKDNKDRNSFYFLMGSSSGTYNLLEVYADGKGNLTTKTYYKTKKGVSQRAISIKNSLHSTSDTDGATLSGAKIPVLFEPAKLSDEKMPCVPKLLRCRMLNTLMP